MYCRVRNASTPFALLRPVASGWGLPTLVAPGRVMFLGVLQGKAIVGQRNHHPSHDGHNKSAHKYVHTYAKTVSQAYGCKNLPDGSIDLNIGRDDILLARSDTQCAGRDALADRIEGAQERPTAKIAGCNALGLGGPRGRGWGRRGCSSVRKQLTATATLLDGSSADTALLGLHMRKTGLSVHSLWSLRPLSRRHQDKHGTRAAITAITPKIQKGRCHNLLT